MTYIGTTIKGLEKAAIEETSGKKFLPGRVEFKSFSSKKTYLTLDKIYEMIASIKFSNLSGLLKKIKSLKIKTKGTFKCTCLREGEQDFNSMMLEQELGKIIEKNGGRYSRDKPANIIFLDVINNICSIGLLKQEDLSKRNYRLKLHSQTIPPLIASCLIKYLKIKDKDSLLCLEAKDGIMPIEAALQGIKNIIAQDRNENNIRNAKVNAKLAKVNLKFSAKSMNEMVYLKNQNYILTSIIFSKENRNAYKTIHDTFSLAEKILKKDLAIITNHPEDLESFRPKSIKLKKQLNIQHKSLTLTILIYKKSA
tara:strand:+ start:2236 stop:3165 length:930 start_codon:yes stop_codon:yes gene_type:complete